MMKIHNKTVAILIAPKFQDEEATLPYRFLKESGAEVKYIGLQKGSCLGKGQTTVDVSAVISEVHPNQFDGLIIPGGAAPEALRLNKDVLEFVRAFMNDAKPVGAICHGPQVLISAGVIKGRALTCFAGIRDDVILAGARYLDQEVVVDHNLITSRVPQDVPAFNKAFGDILGAYDMEKNPLANATPPQLLEFAITNEIRAMVLYETLSKKAKDKLAKAKFKYLAETERAHRDLLTEMFTQITNGQKPSPRDLPGVDGPQTVEIDPDGDLMKILRGAIQKEESARNLYQEVAEKARNPETRALFLRLADEEREHKRLLEQEYGIRTGQAVPSALEKEPWNSSDLW
jgi:protease I